MSKSIYQKLTEPFPKEAYTVLYRTGKELTSIKAQYIVERLNEVFGLGGWRFDGEWKEENDGILFFGELTYSIEDSKGEIRSFSTGLIPGFSDGGKDKDRGDAYKGARTDALSKAASQLGVGNDVFKGLVQADSFKSKLTPKTKEERKEQVEVENETSEELSDSSKTTQDMKSSAARRSVAKKAAPKAQDQSEEEELAQFDDDISNEEETAPKMPAKLKATRLFRRPTEKLNRT